MDLGKVNTGGGEEVETNVDAVRNPGTKCFKCGGVGHMARECPSQEVKGEGKGKKGGGKGDRFVPYGGKSGGKSGGKGGGKAQAKGGGKAAWSPDNGKGGIQGVCRNCGKKGHKAYECWSKGIGEVVDEGTGESAWEQDVGGVTELSRVWQIGQVT